METEDLIFKLVEHPPAHQAEVGHILFPFPRINPAAVAAVAAFERDRSDMARGSHAIAKTVVARPEGGPKYAPARHLFAFADQAQAVSMAGAARELSQADRVCSIPFHARISSPRPLIYRLARGELFPI